MKKILRFTFGLTVLFLLIASSSHAVLFKIATLAPEGAFEVTQMRQASENISKLTQGRVQFKFFTGGVMGNDNSVLRKIRINQLQGGAVSTGALSTYYPDNQIYNLPLIFKSFEELDYVRERMDPVLVQGYEDAGFIIFGIAEGGFARIMSTQPVLSVEDLQKQKVWIPENDNSAIEAVKAFDVSPITLATADVRTGLQTGLLDTVAIPPAYAILLHWHTQISYITELPLLYTAGVLAITKQAFTRLSPQDQTVVKKEMEAAFKQVDKRNRQLNNEAIDVLKNLGIQFVTPDSGANQEWERRAAVIPKRLVDSGILSKQIYNALNKYLEEFRNK